MAKKLWITRCPRKGDYLVSRREPWLEHTTAGDHYTYADRRDLQEDTFAWACSSNLIEWLLPEPLDPGEQIQVEVR